MKDKEDWSPLIKSYIRKSLKLILDHLVAWLLFLENSISTKEAQNPKCSFPGVLEFVNQMHSSL